MPKAKEKPKSFQRPRGTYDLLPDQARRWEVLADRIGAISRFYGFEPIETPHFEPTELFSIGLGRATDIVSKQMYSFKTRGGDSLTLRPEGTAPIARAYVENGMASLPQPVKLSYLGSFFRHETPQRGRFREFRQWGLELIGEESAVADAEIIQIFWAFLADWGLAEVVVEVNSIGCPACRPAYRGQLVAYYRSKVRGLCRNCKDRFRENPLRLLDCTEEKCVVVKKSAPQILDRLCEACRQHFRSLLEYLEEGGVSYVLNPHLVRGFDYYTRTVFETFLEVAAAPAKRAEGLPAQETSSESPASSSGSPARRLAIVSGGRYDGLIELVGGKPTPAVGGAMGLERLGAVLAERGVEFPERERPKAFLVQLGELAKKKSFRLMESLRRAGIGMAESLGRDSIRSQLKIADRLGAAYAIIIGQKEALDGTAILREMAGGSQETIAQDKLIEALKKKFKR